ncbi:MAG: type III secretion system chaperone [Pseudomonadota bacterium]
MVTKEQADIALAAFAEKVGIAHLAFDHSGTALVAFGDEQELIIYYSEQSGQIEVWSPLHEFILAGTPDADDALMRHILEKNFPSSVLDGAYFAIDGEMGVVLLGAQIAIDTHDIMVFADKVTAFAEQVIAMNSTLIKDIAAHSVPAANDTAASIIKA